MFGFATFFRATLYSKQGPRALGQAQDITLLGLSPLPILGWGSPKTSEVERTTPRWEWLGSRIQEGITL